jgi:hypothetical protein
LWAGFRKVEAGVTLWNRLVILLQKLSLPGKREEKSGTRWIYNQPNVRSGAFKSRALSPQMNGH